MAAPSILLTPDQIIEQVDHDAVLNHWVENHHYKRRISRGSRQIRIVLHQILGPNAPAIAALEGLKQCMLLIYELLLRIKEVVVEVIVAAVVKAARHSADPAHLFHFVKTDKLALLRR